jgi:hypothetical protein
MSGGEIAVVPAALVVVPVLAAAAVVAGAGLAAALVIQAARAGTEATGRALEQLGEEMERTAKAQDELEMRTRLWGLAAAAVVQANQELRLLAARAEKAGVRLLLPPPFDLTGLGLADTRGWVAHAQEALAEARATVERAEADREQRALLAKLPAPANGSLTTARLLARYQGVLAGRRQEQIQEQIQERQPVQLSPRLDKSRVHAEIDEILARLDVDATAADRELAILAAARAAKQKEAGASRTFLETLARTIDKEINPKVAGRREAAGWLVALEHPVVADTIADTVPLPPCLRSIERLRAVVRGDTDLTDADRSDALSALAWAQQAVERRRLLEALAETFTGLGYTVTTGMQVHHTDALCVARDGWRDAHSADVWIDEAGSVKWHLVELAPGASGEASRCEDLNSSMRAVSETLTRRGFDATVQVPETLVKPERRHIEGGVVPGWSTEDDARKERSVDPDEVNQ